MKYDKKYGVRKMENTEEKGMKLAEQHWIYIEDLLKLHGEDTKVIEKIGFHHKQAMKHGYKHGISDNVTNKNNVTNITKVTELTNINKSEDIQEEPKSTMILKHKHKRTKTGEWINLIDNEEPLKSYGTLKIWPSIHDYIWNSLPDDFKHEDVEKYFKDFYEGKIKRKLKASSYKTYASRYITYFKEQEPPIMSWDLHNYSKDVNKFKEEINKKVDPESGQAWEPWETKIIDELAPTETPEYIHIHSLPNRTVKAIKRKTEKMGIKKITDSNQARRNLLDSSKKATEDIHEDVHEHAHVHERIDVHEPGLDPKKPSVSEKTKELLAAEKIAEDKETELEFTEEKKKPFVKNPYYEGTAEHHLYQLAINSNWFAFKNGTPLIMINRQMADFPKDQINDAMGLLIKDKRAKRLPNKILLFTK